MTTSTGASRPYRVIVIGAGIAGSEAAYRCARAGHATLLVTTSLDTVYNLEGAGSVLEPPDNTLLQTLWAEVADSDGFASSRDLHRAAKRELEGVPDLHLLQSSVDALQIEAGRVAGVHTWEGVARHGTHVALCVGSFLQARLSLGVLVESAGRLGEMSYDDLYLDLASHGFDFRDLLLDTPENEGRPGYRVSCKVFDPAELSADLRLPRIGGLYGAGLCVGGMQSYETTAQQGYVLGGRLIETIGRADPPATSGANG